MTEPILEVSTASQLCAVTAFVHDARFAIDELQHDVPSGLLRLPFGRPESNLRPMRWWHLLFSRWDAPLIGHSLEIASAISCDVQDEPRIGSYTFNRVTFDTVQRYVHISTAEGLCIGITVRDLNVRVYRTGEVQGAQRLLWIFGCEVLY